MDLGSLALLTMNTNRGQISRRGRGTGGSMLRVLLTVITTFSGTAKLDIDKVNLELLGGFDTNQERRTTASSNNLVGEALALEDEGKGTFL